MRLPRLSKPIRVGVVGLLCFGLGVVLGYPLFSQARENESGRYPLYQVRKLNSPTDRYTATLFLRRNGYEFVTLESDDKPLVIILGTSQGRIFRLSWKDAHT